MSISDHAGNARPNHILFICTGNLGRSPMAEHLLRHLLQQSEIEGIEVSSAGLFSEEGLPAEYEALEIMSERGIDMSGHRSRALTQEMADKADLIIVMEDYHQRLMGKYFENVEKKTHMLGEYAVEREKPKDIPDAFGKDRIVYEMVLGEIKRSLFGLIRRMLSGPVSSIKLNQSRPKHSNDDE